MLPVLYYFEGFPKLCQPWWGHFCHINFIKSDILQLIDDAGNSPNPNILLPLNIPSVT